MLLLTMHFLPSYIFPNCTTEITGASYDGGDPEGRDAELLVESGATKKKTLHFTVKGGAEAWTTAVESANFFFA